MSVKFSSATRLLYAKLRHALDTGVPANPVFLIGPPGIGKTAVARLVANLAQNGGEVGDHTYSSLYDGEVLCEVKDLTSTLPEDLGGLPSIKEDNGQTRTTHAAFDWFIPFTDPNAVGVLVLDDITQAPPSVGVAARQLVLDRAINGNRISDGVLVVVTGNRASDGAAAMTMPSHFRNAVNIISMDADFSSWKQWYARQGYSPSLVSFLMHKESLFSRLPKDADERGAFPTPRTWAKLAADLPPARWASMMYDVAAGYVGEGPAQEFLAYDRMYGGLPAAEEVLRDPKSAIPDPGKTLNTPDKSIGMMVSLGYATARLSRDGAEGYNGTSLERHAPSVTPVEQMLVAATHCCQSNFEYGMLVVEAYKNAGGDNHVAARALGNVMRSQPASKDFYQNILNAIRGV